MELTIGLFVIAALGGLISTILVFKEMAIPIPLAIAHGVLAASALISLFLRVINNTTQNMLEVPLVMFLISALIGFYLLSFHVRNIPHPKKLVLFHGGLSITSFLILLKVVYF